MYKIEMSNEVGTEKRLVVAVENALNAALEMERVPYCTVSVKLCDDEEIKKLNKTFRGVDSATDVLSFPTDEADMLGDIAISIPRAQTQADEFGHSLVREVSFLTVHGALHLIGYDHEKDNGEHEKRQKEILARMGILR